MAIFKDSETTAVIVVLVVASIAVGSYVYAAFHFGWIFSDNATNWGPFGDYFGGILNPAVAVAALYVLVRATRYQKKEFEATRVHLQIEAKKNEVYRVIKHIDEKLEAMLAVDVRDYTGGGEAGHVNLGPLSQRLIPGWKARSSFYLTLGDSNLETKLDQYLSQIRNQIEMLEENLSMYKEIAGDEESVVSKYFEDVYLPMKDACIEIEESLKNN